jgi:hypothetical protein
MKKIIITTLICLLICSCKQKQNKEKDILIDSTKIIKPDSISNNIKFIKLYEEILKNEYIVNPEVTIRNYNELLNKNPDSILSEKIKLRISRVTQDKKFFHNSSGWNIDKNGILKKPKTGLKKIECQ